MFKRLAMVLLLCGAVFRAGATDYTDVWWNPAESGWGVNVVQSDKFSFASIGTATQYGSLISYPASYTCNAAFKTSATVYELKATSLGIEGRWTAMDAQGCREDGRFSAVKE